MARRLAILVANGRFPADARLPSLAGPENDAAYLERALSDPAIGGFEVERLVDSDNHTLNRTLEHALNSARRDDLLLLYYSGHGKLDSKGQLCLAASNTNLDVLRSTSVLLPFLHTLISDCRSEQIVLLLDCCFSGAAAKAFVRSAVEDQLALARSAGLHIFTSSTSIETSRERESEQDGTILGAFTRCIVEGISTGDADRDNDGVVTLGDLREYVESRLRGQSPRYWTLETSGRIVFARAPSIRPQQLPAELLAALTSRIPTIKEAGLRALGEFLDSPNVGLKLAAVNELRRLVDDDSRRLSAMAQQLLIEHAEVVQPGTSAVTTIASTRVVEAALTTEASAVARSAGEPHNVGPSEFPDPSVPAMFDHDGAEASPQVERVSPEAAAPAQRSKRRRKKKAAIHVESPRSPETGGDTPFEPDEDRNLGTNIDHKGGVTGDSEPSSTFDVATVPSSSVWGNSIESDSVEERGPESFEFAKLLPVARGLIVVLVPVLVAITSIVIADDSDGGFRLRADDFPFHNTVVAAIAALACTLGSRRTFRYPLFITTGLAFGLSAFVRSTGDLAFLGGWQAIAVNDVIVVLSSVLVFVFASWLAEPAVAPTAVASDNTSPDTSVTETRDVLVGEADWRCSQCGEALEGQFDKCWKCGAGRATPAP